MRAQALSGRWDEMMRNVEAIAQISRERKIQIDPKPPCSKSRRYMLISSNPEVEYVAA